MIRKILCSIGLHRWKYVATGPWNGWSQEADRTCKHCGKLQGVLLISPISGPVKK